MGSDFVFRGSMFEVYKNLPPKEGMAYLRALVQYGVTGEYEPVEYATVEAVLASLKPGIDKSKARYKKCMDDGMKGGRTKIVNYIDAFMEFMNGRSYEQIAEKFGVSERTVRRRLANPPEGNALFHSMNNSLRISVMINHFVKRAAQLGLKGVSSSAGYSYANRKWEKEYKPEDFEKRFEGSAAGKAYRASRMAFTDLNPEEEERERRLGPKSFAYQDQLRREMLNELRREMEGDS